MAKIRVLFAPGVTIGLLALVVNYVDMEEVIETLSAVEAKAVFLMITLFLLNIPLVTLRLEKIFSLFEQKLAFATLLRATLSGFLGSLFLGSFFGQSMGRQVTLTEHHVRPETISAITLVERIITVLIGGSFCLAGALWIFEVSEFWTWINTTNIVFITFNIALCLAAILYFDALKSRFNSSFLTLFPARKILAVLKIIGISCTSQLLSFVAFIIIILEVAPNTEFFNLVAATTVIVFAASLPISMNGWGIRELTSIAILGEIGISAPSALAISLSVGICAHLSFALLLPYLLKKPKPTPTCPESASNQQKIKTVQLLDYYMITLTSVLILAQITIRPFSVGFSVNLADPFVLVYLSSFLIVAIKTKRLPEWRVPKFNLFIGLFSLVLIFGLLKGYTAIGFTEWAFFGRALGWFVLIAYMLFGFFIINQFGKLGIIRITETLILSLSIIIAVCFLVTIFPSIGIKLFDRANLSQFSGLVMNRNAFAFQLLICSALYVAFAPFLEARKTPARGHGMAKNFGLFEALHGLVVLGICLTGSRAGILTWLIVTSCFMLAGVVKPRLIFRSIAYAIAYVIAFLLIAKLGIFGLSLTGSNDQIAALGQFGVYSAESSDLLRWDTIARGIDMWISNPFFGAGLGVFFETSRIYYDQHIVIHSTPVWVLAELGLVGFTLLIVIALSVFKSAFLLDFKKPENACVLIIMAHFLVFGLVHEIFYQRIFWLAIGLCLAVPLNKRKPVKS